MNILTQVKSKVIFNILFLFFLLNFSVGLEATASSICLQDDNEVTCKITVKNSLGEIQKDVFAKVFGNYKKFEPDENGAITVEYKKNSYVHTATIYFKGEPDTYKKDVNLDAERNDLVIYFDTQKEIMEYKRTARLFPIEGIIIDEAGNPIERAIVSIQGTGRTALTDDIGLFQIEADFNHPIVIRANGMNNLSFPIKHFIKGDEDITITMNKKNSTQVYSSVENMPKFPGGMKAFQQYLNKNLKYPEKAKKEKIEGVVVVQFIVEKTGVISNPRIARHLENSLDSAAYNVIKNMPSWIPGSDFGTLVRCKYSLPIAFKIPVPKPVQPVDSISLVKDYHATDSLRKDSLLAADSIRKDSLLKDSTQQKILVTDSLKRDSTNLIYDKNQTSVKAKKQNFFVRFFRWLFGIERRQRRRAEKEMLRRKENMNPINLSKDSLQNSTKDLDLKSTSNLVMKTDSSSLHFETDSLDINLHKK